jgi:hypothetical protein
MEELIASTGKDLLPAISEIEEQLEQQTHPITVTYIPLLELSIASAATGGTILNTQACVLESPSTWKRTEANANGEWKSRLVKCSQIQQGGST